MFSCEAYAHVPKEKQTKLDNKDVKCIFIRYSYGVKGYKRWDLIEQEVFYFKSVIFRETNPPTITMQVE